MRKTAFSCLNSLQNTEHIPFWYLCLLFNCGDQEKFWRIFLFCCVATSFGHPLQSVWSVYLLYCNFPKNVQLLFDFLLPFFFCFSYCEILDAVHRDGSTVKLSICSLRCIFGLVLLVSLMSTMLVFALHILHLEMLQVVSPLYRFHILNSFHKHLGENIT